jgi:hypothetical protein
MFCCWLIPITGKRQKQTHRGFPEWARKRPQRIGLEIAKQIWGINYNENDNGQFFPTKKGLKQDAA